MDNFYFLTQEDTNEINGGGVVSAVAGGIAGGIIGTVAGLIPAAVKGDASIIAKTAITFGTVGIWAGAATPAP